MGSGPQARHAPPARAGRAAKAHRAENAEESWWRPAVRNMAILGVPAFILLIPVLFGLQRPSIVLYLVAVPTAVFIILRAFSDPELLVAVFVLYIPFNRIYAVALAPGINATNGLEALLVLAWVFGAARERKPLFASLPFTRLTAIWGVLSFSSAITAMVTMGPAFIVDQLEPLKRWSDQFIVFFAFANLIRNGAMARRVCLYMMIGVLVVVVFGFDEWQEKRFYGSIEKARLLGPQLQPNDLGAFLVYGASLPAAWLLTYLRSPGVWLVTLPTFYMMARVLFGTFSRGAFLALGFMGLMLLLVRGRLLLVLLALTGALLVELAPAYLPASVTSRMSQTTNEEGELDESSNTRLILWRAAGQIIKENPVLGTGFATFPQIKGMYTEVHVVESDNHNMFLYIGSQMGLPALLVFVLIFARLFLEGARLSSLADRFGRTMALAACAMAAAVVATNMFGSRMVDICVTAYVWITIAAFAHIIKEQRVAAPKRAMPAKTTAP